MQRNAPRSPADDSPGAVNVNVACSFTPRAGAQVRRRLFHLQKVMETSNTSLAMENQMLLLQSTRDEPIIVSPLPARAPPPEPRPAALAPPPPHIALDPVCPSPPPLHHLLRPSGLTSPSRALPV